MITAIIMGGIMMSCIIILYGIIIKLCWERSNEGNRVLLATGCTIISGAIVLIVCTGWPTRDANIEKIGYEKGISERFERVVITDTVYRVKVIQK